MLGPEVQAASSLIEVGDIEGLVELSRTYAQVSLPEAFITRIIAHYHFVVPTCQNLRNE